MHSPDTTDRSGDSAVVRTGGIALIGGAVAFLAVFSILAARFDYPDVLDGVAADVLPKLLAMGDSGRATWAVYALLPLVWIPAGVGAFHALRRVAEGSMRVAMLFAVVAAMAMMLGLMRWPSIHWELALANQAATPLARETIEAVFAGLNSYLGNWIGEFLGEISFSLFFLLSGMSMLRTGSGFPRWMGWLGIATAIAGLVGGFRNVTGVVAPIADANNLLLPIWMIVFGVGLLRHGAADAAVRS
jgi:hypothetical protein